MDKENSLPGTTGAGESAEVIRRLRLTLGRMELALGAIEEAIVWTDGGGRISWSNAAFSRLIKLRHIDVLGVDLAALLPLEINGKPLPAGEHPAVLGLRGAGGAGSYNFRQADAALVLEISHTPIDNLENGRNCVLTIRDITARRRTEEKLEKLNRMLMTLGEFNQALVRGPDKGGLDDELCRILIGTGGYRLAWVALLRPDGQLRPVAMAGDGREPGLGDRTAISISGIEIPDYVRPVLGALEPLVTSNLRGDPLFAGDKAAEAYDCASRIILPVAAKGRSIGLLCIYSAIPDAFDDEGEIKLLLELAGDLAYGLISVRTRLEMEKALEDLKTSEEKLWQSQKMEVVGRLAGGVAHDFNNLLTAILGYGSLLQSGQKPGDPGSEDLAEIMNAANRAASLTKQLLAFSRRQVLSPEILVLNSVIERMEKMLSRIIGEDMDIALVLDPGLKKTRVDAAQLEQVVLNLAVNAGDAMPKGGKLTIETMNIRLDEESPGRHDLIPPGCYAMLAVSDTGAGMSEETKAHLFEPFFTTKEPGKGTGLGLSTVYGIVKQSGGYIWAYSELGKGTTFKIYFPHTDAPAELQKFPAPAPGDPRGSETVLLVEDDEAVRRLLSRAMRRSGYAVLEARTGIEALELYKHRLEEIGIVVTDLIMPGMGGRALGECLKELRPGLKILYISGYTNDVIIRHGELAEGASFLQKPLTPGVFLAKLRSVLDETE